MDLKEFVAETLVSLVEGISKAQGRVGEMGAFVNPGGLRRNVQSVAPNSTWDDRNNVYSRSVFFDVAISAEDTKNMGGRIRVMSAILGAEAAATRTALTGNVTRVQFEVPILLPVQDIGDLAARNPASGLTVPTRAPNPDSA